MTLGSLFDGSGGFPLAASLVGMTPVWASEIEPYPIAVTRSRFPDMKHLGDICKINGAEIEPVDLITFGSPCQDLSVAGTRAGLGGARSGLFMEAVRIIKEMREATNGKYPRYALWENVPGAFSSNKGEDFRTVLEELIKIAEPSAVMPSVPSGGWACADCYVGDGWSLAYRVFNAQYWGVPQRRRRIHLVCDFAGQRAGEILFKREGLRGDLKASREAREGASGETENGATTYDSRGNGDSKTVTTITGDHNNRVTDYTSLVVTPIHAQATLYIGMAGRGKGNGLGVGEAGDPANTLTAGDRHAVCIGNGQTNQSISELAGALNCMHDQQVICQTLTARMDGSPQPDKGTGAPIVCLTPYEHQSKRVYSADGTAPALSARERSGQNQQSVCYRPLKQGDESEEAPTQNNTIVRRLTPTECARLQGFPDCWGHPDRKTRLTDEEYSFWLDVRTTHAQINGKQVKHWTRDQMLRWYNGLHTDAAEYKMWGNGIALPPALYCMEGFVDD